MISNYIKSSIIYIYINMEIGSDYNLNIKINNKKLFYFSGRIAIKEILNKINYNNDKCLIPNYLCDSIFNCFSNYEYYNIDNKFDIDIDYLQNKIINDKYKLIFIINYFGNIDKNIKSIINLCKKNNIIIIEDFTHNIYSNKLYGDICLCSYRKSLPTPFGAVVIDKKEILNINQKKKFNLIYIFLILYKLFGMFLKNYKLLKWIWRPILLFCEKNINIINYSGFDYLNNLLYTYYFDKDDIIIRKKNIEYLNNNLKLKTIKKFKNNYFTYVLIFKSKELRDNIRKILIENKIYCPIYWPLNFDLEYKCNHYLTNNILCIPIDQRYNIKHMEYICRIINQHL